MSALTIARARILTLTDIIAIITAESIYPIVAPQSAVPPLLIQNSIGRVDTITLAGQGKFWVQRIAVESIAVTAQQAIDINDLLVEQLPCIALTVGGGKDVSIVDADTDWTDNSDDRSIFRTGHHFRVHWRSV